MNKFVKLTVTSLCAATIGLGACAFARCDGGENSGSTATTEIVITGSSSVTPLMQVLGEVYEVLNDDVAVTVQTSDSGTGIADAIAGKNDFGMASRALKDSETAQGVTSQTICTDGVALIVNNSSTLSDVTIEEVYDLYLSGTAIGDVVNAITREDGSGTRGAFDELIKKDGTSLASALEANGGTLASCVTIQNSTGAVKSAIQSNSAGNTLGYISMGSLDSSVKALTLNGVEATAENVTNGTYALSRPFNIVYKSYDDLSDAAKDFIEFIVSPAGQYIAEINGYVV